MINRRQITKIGAVSSMIVALFSSAGPAFAQTTMRDLVKTKVASAAASKQEERLTTVKNKSQQAIDQRTNRITSTSTLIKTLDFLTTEQRQAIQAQLDPVSAGLTALSTTIQADTTLESARADYKKIFADYRVFAVVLPRVRLEVYAQHLLLANENLVSFVDTLSARIAEEKSQGANTAKLEGQVATLKTKLVSNKTAIDTAMTSIEAITVKNYPSTNQTIKSVRSQLQSIHTTLKTSYKDAKTIVAGIKALKKSEASAKPTASSSAKPTASASASPAL